MPRGAHSCVRYGYVRSLSDGCVSARCGQIADAGLVGARIDVAAPERRGRPIYHPVHNFAFVLRSHTCIQTLSSSSRSPLRHQFVETPYPRRVSSLYFQPGYLDDGYRPKAFGSAERVSPQEGLPARLHGALPCRTRTRALRSTAACSPAAHVRFSLVGDARLPLARRRRPSAARGRLRSCRGR